MSCNCDSDKSNNPISSLGSAVKDFVNGNFAGIETIQARYDTCVNCEHLIKHSAFPPGNCAKCGCFVYLKIKMQNQKCPEGKW